MDALTLDQFQVFTAVVEEGSFSAAARRLNRAQSAVTYAIQKLEEQSGVELFDRSAYRPALTEAGRALSPRAQQILQELAAYRAQARGMAEGLEPELSLVVDSMFPIPALAGALHEFQSEFPSVVTRIYVESIGAAVQPLLEGSVDLGLVLAMAAGGEELERLRVADIPLLIVAAPTHPLTKVKGAIPVDVLRQHLQLVLTDRSALTRGRDHGVVATRTWRLADLGAKRAMLMAGLGWGSMPRHFVEDDLADGRLVSLRPEEWDGFEAMPVLSAVLAYKRRRELGPAGRWMLGRLSQMAQGEKLTR